MNKLLKDILNKPDLKVLITLYHVDHIPVLSDILKVFDNNKIKNRVIVSFDYYVSRELKKRNIVFKTVRDYVNIDEYYDVYEKAIFFAENWYKHCQPNKQDITLYKGFSTGSIIQNEMVSFFTGVTRGVTNVNHILQIEKPDSVVLIENKSKVENIHFSDDESYDHAVLKKKILHSNLHYILVNQNPPNFYLKNSIGRFKKIISFTSTIIYLNTKAVTIKLPFFLMSLAKWFFLLNQDLYKYLYWAIIKKNVYQNTNIILLANEETIPHLSWNVINHMIRQKGLFVGIMGGIRNVNFCLYIINKNVGFIRSIKNYLNYLLLKNKCKNNEKTKTVLKYKDFFKYRNVYLGDYIEDRFDFIFAEKYPKLALIIDNTCSLLKSEMGKIKLVITSEDTTEVNKAKILVCNFFNIPTLVVQHGAPCICSGYIPVSAVKIAVYGEFSKRWFLQNKVEPEKIVVTGPPRFDAYKANKDRNTGQGDYILFIPPISSKKVVNRILDPKDDEFLFYCIVNAAIKLPAIKFIVKLRPEDLMGKTLQKIIYQNKLKNISLLYNADNKKLLESCSLLITDISTMGIEALYFDKPVIQLLLSFKQHAKISDYCCRKHIMSDKEWIPLARYGAAVGVYRENDLLPVIRSILETRQARDKLALGREKFLRDYCCYEEESAGTKVISLINGMITLP